MLLQATSSQETAAAATDSSEGLLNLLLLADSSLQDYCSDISNDMPNQTEAVTEQRNDEAKHRDAEDSVIASQSLHTADDQPSISCASQQRPSSAGALTTTFLPANTT